MEMNNVQEAFPSVCFLSYFDAIIPCMFWKKSSNIVFFQCKGSRKTNDFCLAQADTCLNMQCSTILLMKPAVKAVLCAAQSQ